MSEQNQESTKIKELLEENLRLNREIHEMVKGVKKYIMWQNIFGMIKVFIIIVPIILGFIYLPPLLKEVFQQYQSMLGIGSGLDGIGISDIEGLLK